jgi:hypothetical protein
VVERTRGESWWSARPDLESRRSVRRRDGAISISIAGKKRLTDEDRLRGLIRRLEIESAWARGILGWSAACYGGMARRCGRGVVRMGEDG